MLTAPKLIRPGAYTFAAATTSEHMPCGVPTLHKRQASLILFVSSTWWYVLVPSKASIREPSAQNNSAQSRCCRCVLACTICHVCRAVWQRAVVTLLRTPPPTSASTNRLAELELRLAELELQIRMHLIPYSAPYIACQMSQRTGRLAQAIRPHAWIACWEFLLIQTFNKTYFRFQVENIFAWPK
jgi:hypothetical protein